MIPRSIPVARPKLPDADALLPHLRAIDARRIYSNWGPLNAALEQQLGERFGASVVTCSSATDGITCALRAALEDRPAEKRFGLCLMPSWTFVATPHAALAAGLTPCFLDVEEGSWILTPDMVRRELLAGLKSNLPIAAVVVVAPFGLQVAPGPWDAFTAETGIPVVIDSAAAFDGLSVARTPSVVSLHATKTVCAGEGGFIATRDADLAKRIKRVANLGFLGTRLAEVPATNAKLSEYHAAVALCSLAGWPERRAEFLSVAERLRAVVEPSGAVFQAGFGESWVGSTCMLRLPEGLDTTQVAMALGLRGIATRSWWGFGCHTSPAFAHMPRRNHAAGNRLPATEVLAHGTIGIPFYCDMSDEEIAQIGAAFAAITSAAPDAATEVHVPLPGAFPTLVPA